MLFVAAPGEPAFEIEVVEKSDGGFVSWVVGDEDEGEAEAWVAEVLRFEGDFEDELGLGGGLGFGVLCLFRHVYSPDSIMGSGCLISGSWSGDVNAGSGGECAGCGFFELLVIRVGGFSRSGDGEVASE